MTSYQPYILCEESPSRRIFNYYNLKCNHCGKGCKVRADFLKNISERGEILYITRCPYPECTADLCYKDHIVIYKEDPSKCFECGNDRIANKKFCPDCGHKY
jgi:hypothetical protein